MAEYRIVRDGYAAPPSAPVGVEGMMQLAREWCLSWGEWAHDADPGCAKKSAAEAALRAALTQALAQQPAPSVPVGVVEAFEEYHKADHRDPAVASEWEWWQAAWKAAVASQPAAVDEAMRKVAAIAHSGGLIGMSPHDALTAIRHLSLPYWGKEEKPEQVRAALTQQPAPSAPEAEPATYNRKRIAWELERTAMGDGHYGSALRAAKDFPEATTRVRLLLDRWATGRQLGLSDRTDLCAFALQIYEAEEESPISLVEVEGLPRYGFPNGTEPRPVPCVDGYWTPWHLARATAPLQAEIEALKAEVVAQRARADAMAGEAIKHEARAERLVEALRIAEAALADIGDAVREPGDDVAWCERRAALGLRRVRDALRDHDQEKKGG